MIIPYSRLVARPPGHPLENVGSRLRPLLNVLIVGPPRIALVHEATLDTGSDDTVFPASMADDLGLDLSNAPGHRAWGVGGRVVSYRYAEVELQIRDDEESYTWDAIVGFGEAVSRGLLGHAGFMQYFDIEFLGDAKQIVIEPNASFPGLRRELKVP